jgi:hypothetical protein
MVLMLSASTTLSHAQTHDDHAAGAITPPHTPTRDESAVICAVRDATARFKNVTSVDGPGEGYALNFGCVSGGEFGAMGLHYVNMDLVNDGDIDVRNPEIILFEPPGAGAVTRATRARRRGVAPVIFVTRGTIRRRDSHSHYGR